MGNNETLPNLPNDIIIKILNIDYNRKIKEQKEHKTLFDETLDLIKIRGRRIDFKIYSAFISVINDSEQYDIGKYFYPYEFEEYYSKYGYILDEDFDEMFLMMHTENWNENNFSIYIPKKIKKECG
tara:strand:- start:439 stop:816 length:378 start_codon:yes stop_codon:yes gene_type:complete